MTHWRKRLRHGLLWRTSKPPFPWRWIGVALAGMAGYWLVCTITGAREAQALAEAAQAKQGRVEAVLIALLNEQVINDPGNHLAIKARITDYEGGK